MARQYYSRRHYARLSNGGPDTVDQIAWRLARNAAADQLSLEMEAKFPEMNAGAGHELTEWVSARMPELVKEFLGKPEIMAEAARLFAQQK